jgi:hypothetical protein
VQYNPVLTDPPANSKAQQLLAGSYFHDAWAIVAAQPALDPLEQFLRVAQQTPRWVDTMMHWRNRLVSLVGLKNLGGLSHIDPTKSASAYRVGDRVGIFTLMHISDTEVLLGDSDKHLDVVVSVHKQPPAPGGATMLTVTTVVKVHNWLGRLYMIPVRPAHHFIAKAMVRKIGVAS